MKRTSSRGNKYQRTPRRQGSVLILAVLMMIVMFGMLALAVDVGYILTADTQAQRAADSAALAAALELATVDRADGDVLSIYSDARGQAIHFAALNRIGGEGADLERNDSNLEVGDIVLGRLDDTANRSEQMSFGDWQNYNAVTVHVRRTEDSNGGRLPLFFARVLGVHSTNVTASATAAFADGISGFRATERTGNTNLLPFVVHVDAWTDMMNGVGTDNFHYDEDTGAVTPGSDGILEINMFPSSGGNGGGNAGLQSTPEWFVAWQDSSPAKLSRSASRVWDDQLVMATAAPWQAVVLPQMLVGPPNGNGNGNGNGNNGNGGNGGGNDPHITPGNFGTVDIGDSNNSTADLVRQIEQGVSAADLDHHGGSLELDGQTDTLELNGDTGISAGMESALEGVIGDGRVIMLYDTVTGQGNTTMFTIVGFVGIRIVEVELNGGDKHITVQPALVVDNTTISSSTSGTSYFIHQTPRLVR